MKYSTEQLKKFYTFSAIKISVWIVLSVVIIFIFYKEIKKEVDLLYEERTQNEINAVQEDNINKLKNAYQQVEQDIPNIKEVVPVSGAKLFEVLRIFKSLGEFSAKQVAITFSENSKTDSLYNEIVFNIYAQGTVAELTSYIKLLESLPYGVNFVSYDITGQGGIKNNNELRLQTKIMFRKK